MFRRFAVFYTPGPGRFADFGAAWLGWDSRHAKEVPHPDIAGLDVAGLTETPRKYGFHATLKAPFRLAQGHGEPALLDAVDGLAKELQPVGLSDVRAEFRHGFVALRPAAASGRDTAVGQLAERVMRELDWLRAPLSDEDRARRRVDRLTARQRGNLERWGYPFVAEEFNFHLTLTGRTDSDTAARLIAALQPVLVECQPALLSVDSLTVLGESCDGRFHEMERFPISIMAGTLDPPV
ncbi:DUF1045 domain-containing protein [Sulfitobacter sp. LCG007]